MTLSYIQAHDAHAKPAEPKIDWSSMRRPRPLDRLLPGTIEWGSRLPDHVRPTQLMVQYPRVANRLAIAWQDPRTVAEVFDDVLVDRRGGRRGFPPVAHAELLSLRSFVQGAQRASPACPMV